MRKIASIFVALGCASCATTPTKPSPGSVDHVVLVWLKRPGNPQDRRTLLESGDRLREIPGVSLVGSGTALPSDRPVVDDSFDVGFVMRFDSVEELKTYESHPLHQGIVKETLAPLSRKIVVYDITR